MVGAFQDRKIALGDTTAYLFNKQYRNKQANDPLISRKNGLAWDKDAWKKPIKVAAVLAELPSTVTAYTLRRSTITNLVHGGLDTMTVAQLVSTSILMIEKHYGHLTREHSKSALSLLKI